MEYFNEECSKQLLAKEWLVRIDNSSSTSYLFKFCILPEDDSCCLLITDTKTVWAEVLSQKQVLRRWRDYNTEFFTEHTDEQSSRVLNLLSSVHTYGGVASASFDVVKSREADLAFDLDFDEFKWHWETYLIGPKSSAEVISQHLIMPLLSVTHLAFASADPVSELSDADLESAVDKLGRTARRAREIHVKHTISKPRIATSLQRISAMLEFAPTLPAINSEPEEIDVDEQLALLRGRKVNSDEDFSRPSANRNDASQRWFRPSTYTQDSKANNSTSVAAEVDGSATEESDIEMVAPSHSKPHSTTLASGPSAPAICPSPVHGDEPPPKSIQRKHDEGAKARSPSFSSPSPPPSSKRIKARPVTMQINSDSDSPDVPTKPSAKGTNTGQAGQSSQSSHGGRSGTAGGSLRSVRQPIKRGGKRF